ncbi:beta-ketoacyl-ACP synthase [bacterium]|nr:beta-ketoacyl-ACP synthase [bacterium]
MKITSYEALCNLGNDINSIYEKALNGDTTIFKNIDGVLKESNIRAGVISCPLPKIDETDFNIRCNQAILKTLNLLDKEIEILKEKYIPDRIGVVVATTNSGVEEFEKTNNPKYYELGNPARFIRKTLGIKNFCTTVSTACSSGIKAFSLARDLLNNNISDAVIVACCDTLAKVPIYGFHSLEVLSQKPTIPFSKDRAGMNMGEACTVFITEKEADKGIEVMGIGESSDIYHLTTPDPEAKEAVIAIKKALSDAKITPDEIDYINAHGTGTIANDIMEANAIYSIFNNKTPVSSTKSYTGHCLGAAAGIETALCCKLLDDFRGKFYPNINADNIDPEISQINLVKKDDKYKKCKICMCNSFGFGGTNAILILGKNNG